MKLNILTKLIFSFLAAAAAASGSTLSISPSSPNVFTTQFFTLSIDVSGVTDLAGWQLDIGFDPTVLQAIEVDEGSFMTNVGPTFFDPGTIDNTGGTVTATLDFLDSGSAFGSGTLATVEFEAVGVGHSPVNLLNIVFLDSTLSQFEPDTVFQSRVTVALAPEPGTFLLFAVPLVGLACRILKQRRQQVRA